MSGKSSEATAIAQHYGLRLSENSGNLDSDALNWLITAYPTHGFVIDRAEASGLFENVRPPNEYEKQLIEALGDRATDPRSKDAEFKQFLSDERNEEVEDVAASEATENPVQGPTNGEIDPNAGGDAERALVFATANKCHLASVGFPTHQKKSANLQERSRLADAPNRLLSANFSQKRVASSDPLSCYKIRNSVSIHILPIRPVL